MISASEIAAFEHNGYIKVKNIATKQQIETFRPVFQQAVKEVAENNDRQKRIDDYSTIFTQVTNLWHLQPQTQEFILHKTFASVACQLLGVDHVRLYHDQALVKNPSANKTPWHQDYFYWPIDSPKTVTMWLPLHDCPRTMGTMKFVKGSHQNSNIKAMPISEQSEQYFQAYIKEADLQVQTFDLEQGDATFHYGKTLHCAHGNTTGGKRQVMTIIFMQDGARAMKEQQMNEFRKVDLSVFCPKINYGEVIDSEMNPLLF